MEFSKDELEDARDFAHFFFDMMENHKETFSYYLSHGAVLDWFGRTVKGVPRIKEFVKFHIGSVKHKFSSIEPCHKIGHRKSHAIPYSTLRGSELSHSEVKPDVSQEKTPPNATTASGSRKREMGQGDGLHNYSESPVKRTRLSQDLADSKDTEPIHTANITSTGSLEFRARSCKKYQKETKWERPCTFQVAYSKTPTGYLVHLMIYKDNMRCKRNLMKDFDAVPNVETN